MRLYDILQPIAEYVGRLKKRETLMATGTVRAVVGGYAAICTLILKPNREYIVFGASDLDGNFNPKEIMSTGLKIKKAKVVRGTLATRTTNAAGGGCQATAYVKTGNDQAIAELYGYGYSAGTYNYRGDIIAIEI